MIKSWSYFKVKQLCITAALTAVREWFVNFHTVESSEIKIGNL